MITVIFHDFPGLENFFFKLRDFPRLSRMRGNPVYSAICRFPFTNYMTYDLMCSVGRHTLTLHIPLGSHNRTTQHQLRSLHFDFKTFIRSIVQFLWWFKCCNSCEISSEVKRTRCSRPTLYFQTHKTTLTIIAKYTNKQTKNRFMTLWSRITLVSWCSHKGEAYWNNHWIFMIQMSFLPLKL